MQRQELFGADKWRWFSRCGCDYKDDNFKTNFDLRAAAECEVSAWHARTAQQLLTTRAQAKNIPKDIQVLPGPR